VRYSVMCRSTLDPRSAQAQQTTLLRLAETVYKILRKSAQPLADGADLIAFTSEVNVQCIRPWVVFVSRRSWLASRNVLGSCSDMPTESATRVLSIQTCYYLTIKIQY